MAIQKYYPTTRHSVSELVSHMESFLANDKNMETQQVQNLESSFTLLQARAKGGGLKQIVGLDKAVSLRFVESPNVVNVEIGEAKWVDKGIVMTVSMFVLWPLAVTSGIGIYSQKKLLKDLTSEMDSYMLGTL